MDNLWIVVAHQGGARFFGRNRPSEGLRLIENWEHPEGRLRDRDIQSDRPGRTDSPTPSPVSPGGRGGRGPAVRDPRRSGYSTLISPHESEAIRFAQRIARYLETARSQNRYFKIVLVAGPDELGLLKESLDKTTSERVIAYVNKNLAWVPNLEVENHLFDELADVDERLILRRSG